MLLSSLLYQQNYIKEAYQASKDSRRSNYFFLITIDENRITVIQPYNLLTVFFLIFLASFLEPVKFTFVKPLEHSINIITPVNDVPVSVCHHVTRPYHLIGASMNSPTPSWANIS